MACTQLLALYENALSTWFVHLETAADIAGRELVRINLSEQTDMMDLLGADLPVEGGAPGEFAWYVLHHSKPQLSHLLLITIAQG